MKLNSFEEKKETNKQWEKEREKKWILPNIFQLNEELNKLWI